MMKGYQEEPERQSLAILFAFHWSAASAVQRYL